MVTEYPNKADAPSAAMAPELHSDDPWRGVGDLRRCSSMRMRVLFAPSRIPELAPLNDWYRRCVKYTTISYPTQVRLSVAVAPEGAWLRFTGDTGRTYRFQRASTLVGSWLTLDIVTAPPGGAVEHLDPRPLPNPAFYRVIAP